MNTSSDRAVAIVGLGAVLPDAPTAPAFWQNIVNKHYSIIETPADRWGIADYYDPDPAAPDKTYSKIGAWVRGFQFDWKRYRIPPKVAASMDEGQQWAVTIAAEALADYGYPNRPLDTDRTGVILGTAMGGELHYTTTMRAVFPEYANALRRAPEFAGMPATTQQALLDHWRAEFMASMPPITEDTMPGELPNIVAGRVANVLNLRGPNFITDAACASSFAAVNAAVEMLTEHHVDVVVAGGVDRNMGAGVFIKFCKIGALSATGSRPFGAGADGFVMGEGSGAFLLKRLADAERDGDKIYAVIRGVGGSSDGKARFWPFNGPGRTPGSTRPAPPWWKPTAPAPKWAMWWKSKVWRAVLPAAPSRALAWARPKATSATSRRGPVQPACSRRLMRSTTRCCRRPSIRPHRIPTSIWPTHPFTCSTTPRRGNSPRVRHAAPASAPTALAAPTSIW
jgi:acyl transferase domain-containing protein